MTSDPIPWRGPACPVCGRELDAEAIASSTGLAVVYTCPEHGVMLAEADPFGTHETPIPD